MLFAFSLSAGRLLKYQLLGRNQQLKRDGSRMKTYHLFQFHMSAEQQARMDAGDTHVRTAAMKAGLGQIGDALAMNMYRHVASLKALDEDEAFLKARAKAKTSCAAGDRFEDQGKGTRETGVGDIVIDVEDGDAWVRAPSAWENLSWDRCAKFFMMAHELELTDPEPEDTSLEPAL